MNPANDAPQSRPALTTAPVAVIHTDARRAERVRMIFERKYEHLCMLALKYLNRSDVFAEDIVEDVLEAALIKWPQEKFDQIKDLESFICRCVINRSKNTRKRNKRQINIHDLPIDTFSIPNPMAKIDLDIDALLKILPPKQSEAFALFCKGYTHEEIAQMMGLSGEGASKNLIYYAKKKLRKLWEDRPDPDDPAPSPTGKKAAENASNRILRPAVSGPGYTPPVRDLLNYLQGNELGARVGKNIKIWLVENPFAGDVLSGLKIALKNQTDKDLENRFRKSKNSLRERLFGNHGVKGSRNSDLESQKNNCNLFSNINDIYPRLIIPAEKPPLNIIRPAEQLNFTNSANLIPFFRSILPMDILGYRVTNPIKPDETSTLSFCIITRRPNAWNALKMKKGKKKSVETI